MSFTSELKNLFIRFTNQLKSSRAIELKRGFTLLELLLYTGLLAIVMLVVVNIFFSVNKGSSKIEAQNEVNSNLRFAIDKINADIRGAASVTTPAAAGATSTTLAINVSGTVISYCLNGSQLMRQASGTCGASSEAITGALVGVANLIFTRMENTNVSLNKTVVSVSASMNGSYNSSSSDWQYSQSTQTTVSLR